MRKPVIVTATLLLMVSTLACSITPPVPDISVPTLEVGEMQEERHAIPHTGVGAATVKIVFGVGKLELEAGVSDELFSGRFRYNVDKWTPEITHEDGALTIRQGGNKESWGIPTGRIHNEWKLEFSPETALEMDAKLGAGNGEFDFTGLQLTALDLDMGSGDFVLRFDEPNTADMSRFALSAGASKLEVLGVGNANPEQLNLQGGVGDISLDLTGAWTRTGEIQITAGAGSLTLRLPDNMGILVETQGGLSNVKAPDLRRVGDTYVNGAFGKVDKELHIQITTGVGSVRLIEVPNES